MKTKDLIDEICDLPLNERAKIADAVLNTLNQPTSEIEQVWLEEVEERASQVESGEVEMIPQEQFERMRENDSIPS